MVRRKCGRCGGLMVSMLDLCLSSWGLSPCIAFLGKTLCSHSTSPGYWTFLGWGLPYKGQASHPGGSRNTQLLNVKPGFL